MDSLKKERELILEKLSFNHGGKERYLSDDLKSIPDPNILLDIDKASNRLIKAIDNNETIGLYADYDTDGVTSIAILGRFLRDHLKANVRFYQPNRFTHGYGLNEEIVRQMSSDGVNVVVTLDCGISDVESSKVVKDLKMDLIVTDHHTDGHKDRPVAYALVNPKRVDQDNDEEIKNLAGCGVAFMLCLKMKRDLERLHGLDIPSIGHLLELVAVGTIGDLVNLCPMNLILVRWGIGLIKNGSKIPGLRCLVKDIDPLIFNSTHISFYLAPIFNAKGRMGDPKLARDLLLENDFEKCREIAKKMIDINNERKKIQKENESLAIEIVLKEKLYKDNCIVLCSEEFHQGVMGIVASKIVNLFDRPVIILTNDSLGNDTNEYKGSVRGNGRVDMFGELSKHKGLFSKFGGHKEACGLSIQKDNIDKLKRNIQTLKIGKREDIDTYFELSKGAHFSLSMAMMINSLGPYGQNNPAPTFLVRGIVERYELIKDAHLKIFVDVNGLKKDVMYFNYYPNGNDEITNIALNRPNPEDFIGKEISLEVIFSLGEYRGYIEGQFHAKKII
ncbi:MAG: single-stranded-DNA-specific exonuclease RecJ [Oligoflexia bacterium]|nr:single-stranded-DNA-specific exonuclease RecJ [Oligoflexia bacterium]